MDENRFRPRILIADDDQEIVGEYAQVLCPASDDVKQLKDLAQLESELFDTAATAVNPDRLYDFDLVICQQGDEAVAAVEGSIAEANPFAVAFLDVRMPPGPNGIETAERLRRIDPRINIVLVTGYSDVRPEDLATRLAPLDKLLYCRKPLDPAEIRQFAYALSAKWAVEESYRRTQSQLERILHSTPAIIYTFANTEELPLRYMSENIHQYFGYEAAKFGQFQQLVDCIHPDDQERLLEDVQRVRNGGEAVTEFRFRTCSGAYHWVSSHMGLIRDESSNSAEVAACWTDVTERRNAESRIRYLAYFDDLTGLPNRMFMREMLDRSLANAGRHGRRVGLMFIDIDQFKRINDTLGHDRGDALLQEVSKRLLTCVRKGDSVFADGIETFPPPAPVEEGEVSRLGGDEFVIILSELASSEDAANVARRISDALLEPINLGREKVSVTASLGIAVYPDDGTDTETLLKNADAAMYAAKAEGRNCFRFFTNAINQKILRRFSIETHLREALDRGDLRLFYEPRIALDRMRLIGVEALLRWQRSSGEIIAPTEFIPVAEDTGLIGPIGDWVLDEACRQMAAWREEGLGDFLISINVSPLQFRNMSFIHRIGQALTNSGLPANRLELELTETVLMDNLSGSAELVQRLKDIGVGISIDDFGTGYSSLSYLRQFPVDKLKIDQSLVADAKVEGSGGAIVVATISLAHALNLTVVAEGVETVQQMEFLRLNGCDEAQGYLFTHPLDARAAALWLLRHAQGFTPAKRAS